MSYQLLPVANLVSSNYLITRTQRNINPHTTNLTSSAQRPTSPYFGNIILPSTPVSLKHKRKKRCIPQTYRIGAWYLHPSWSKYPSSFGLAPICGRHQEQGKGPSVFSSSRSTCATRSLDSSPLARFSCITHFNMPLNNLKKAVNTSYQIKMNWLVGTENFACPLICSLDSEGGVLWWWIGCTSSDDFFLHL